jgi:hypothetical protein
VAALLAKPAAGRAQACLWALVVVKAVVLEPVVGARKASAWRQAMARAAVAQLNNPWAGAVPEARAAPVAVEAA